MQFGPSLDKSKIMGLVTGTGWNEFLELNRLAFSDALPRNSESRALGIAFRLIRKHYPHVQWIVSFADGAQCGDGTIYRASGFALTGIKKNNTIWELGGETFSRVSLTDPSSSSEKARAVDVASQRSRRFSRVSLTDTRRHGEFDRALRVTDIQLKTNPPEEVKRLSRVTATKAGNILSTGAASMSSFKEMGFRPIPGFQLRYIYFLDPSARERLTVSILPFSKIDEMGARMYKGKARAKQAMAEHPSEQRRRNTDPHAPNNDGPPGPPGRPISAS